MAQVAGRAGRGPQGGIVLVQTFNPEHPSIAMAAKHNYQGFAEVELKNRLAHQYPPYQRMVRLVVRSKDTKLAEEFAETLTGAFRTGLGQAGPGELRLLGPAEAPIFKLKGYYRFHFQLQSPSSAYLHRVLRAVLPVVRIPKKVDLTIDIDPLDML
jgi:primosomal protein N' (replication factor Y)